MCEGTLPRPSCLSPSSSALLDAGLAVGHLLLLLHQLLVVVVKALLLLLRLILVNVVVPCWSRDLTSKLSSSWLMLLLLWLLCLPDVADVVHDQFWSGDYPGDYNSV